MSANSVISGRHANLRADTTQRRTGCQVVEFDYDGTKDFTLACGLPPFATVYAGEYDDKAHEDIQPVLCWKHLLELGDTTSLIVRPFGGAS